MTKLTPGVLVVLTGAVLLIACGGNHAKTNGSPDAGIAAKQTPPAVLLDDLRPVLPAGWALKDWAASSDGAYVAVLESGVDAEPLGTTSDVLSVFRRSSSGAFSEAARYLAFTGRQIRLVRDGELLNADTSGRRRLALEYYDASGTADPYPALLVIDAAGIVTTDLTYREIFASPPALHTAVGSLPDNPVALIASTPEKRFPSDTPAPLATPVPVPAGAVPPGWRLLQSAASPDGKAFAVVTHSRLLKGEGDVLSVYQIRDDRLVERWRKVNSFIDLDAALTFRDINGDGRPDVVYTSSSGGNGWTQTGTYAATLQPDGSVEELQFHLPISASAPKGPVDLNGDGIYEWTAIDASWELRGFGHVDSPGSEFILAWDGSAYSDASARFGDTIVAKRADPVPPAVGAACREQDGYLSALVSRYLDYWNADRKNDAARIREQLRAFTPLQALVAKRDVLVRAIAADPHAPEPGLDLKPTLGCPA